MNLNFRTLDLNLLRVFDAVMSEGSLTRAAETLAMTQPAVSHAVRRLREALGEDLFVRCGRRSASRWLSCARPWRRTTSTRRATRSTSAWPWPMPRPCC
jgi:DNA-binding transcriptional LysR family regulator